MKQESTTVNSVAATLLIVFFVIGIFAYYSSAFNSIGSIADVITGVTMGGEFRSIKSCLSTIESKAGPLKIYKDTTTKILGTTSTGKLFLCERIDSGSRGTYYTGWYITSG